MSFAMREYALQQKRYRRKILILACLKASVSGLRIAHQELVEEERRQRKPRSCWTRAWLERRPMYGQFEQLMRELADEDPKAFRIFQRLTPEVWNHVYDKVSPLIEKRTTPMRPPISAGHRLAITLRFLASGDSYRSHMFGFRVADNTICGIVPETCEAIHKVLAPDYFKV